MNGSHRVVLGLAEWFWDQVLGLFGTTARAVLMLNRNGAEIFFYVISCGAKDFVRNNAFDFRRPSALRVRSDPPRHHII